MKYAHSLRLIIYLMSIFFFNNQCWSQVYEWQNTGSPSFFEESNWLINNASFPENEAVNSDKEINHNLLIENTESLVGPVGGNIKTGTGKMILKNAQLVMNIGKAKGIDMGTGRQVKLTDSRITTNFIHNADVALENNSEIHVYASQNAINNSTFDLKSDFAKVYFENINAQQVNDNLLSGITVNGVSAIHNQNIRIMPYYNGTVVYPLSLDNQAMIAYQSKNYAGDETTVKAIERFVGNSVPVGQDQISSLILRKGYVAVLAENSDGTGERTTLIADEDDLFVSDLSVYNLNNKVSLLRIMPWRWTLKKGNSGGTGHGINEYIEVSWFYDWGSGRTSDFQKEYVPMVWGAGGIANGTFQNLIDKFEEYKNINTILAFNEPDNCNGQSGQWNNLCDPEQGVEYYKTILSLGLRTGAPAVTNNARGWDWLDIFMEKATEQNLKVDFIPVHYYNTGNAAGFMSRWSNLSEKWGVPIWITEFNYGGSWTNPKPSEDLHATRIAEFLDAMEEAHYVERYALFAFNPDNYYGWFETGALEEFNDFADWWKNYESNPSRTDFKTNKDCNGVAGGYAFIDGCGTCVSGNTNRNVNQACATDSNINSLTDNLAINGIATQSTTAYNGVASRAIDGNTNGKYRGESVTHTKVNDGDAWWQVDLGSNQTIGSVVVWNRIDSCCSSRLSNFKILVLNNNGQVTYQSTLNNHMPNPSYTTSTNGAVGRYVRIELIGSGTLSLAEVEVFRNESSTSNKSILEEVVLGEDILIYPNPVLNKATVQGAANSTLRIYDMNGALVLTKDISTEADEIDLSNVASGIYYAKVASLQGVDVIKILKE